MTLDPEILDFYDVEVIRRIMEKYGYDEKTAAVKFFESQTYRMLVNPDMGMCRFGPDGIFDVWENELITGRPQTSQYIKAG